MDSRTSQSQSSEWGVGTVLRQERAALRCVTYLLVAAAALWAPSAWAAQVLDVRVGHHADYTRVVFELDAFVGYQIEQHGSDLVVALDAGAEATEIKPSKGLIEAIEVAPAGRSSVVHIQLDKGGLKLKEMTLANPPRIVIDILSPVVAAKPVAAKPVAKATPPALPTSGSTSDGTAEIPTTLAATATSATGDKAPASAQLTPAVEHHPAISPKPTNAPAAMASAPSADAKQRTVASSWQVKKPAATASGASSAASKAPTVPSARQTAQRSSSDATAARRPDASRCPRLVARIGGVG